MRTIELLAPARDAECGMAAIRCGADAVYVGAPKFGAREDVGNPVEDIAELVKFAHRYWAKVYVTFNTILYDDEIPEALELIGQLYEAGIDGLIVQDMGLLECDLPPIKLISSTQMHNTTPEKVAFLSEVGFKRAILARELSLEEIAAIRAATSIELECFIHGALCVSYSGQCYLSQAMGGRSANRGACAQPCRKSYRLEDDRGNVLTTDAHLLSLRDLNLSDHLKDLVEAGIGSFKIEGRLKDITYVTNVVTFYRQRIDAVIKELGMKRASSGKSIADFTPDIDKTFNRGYTTYFVDGRQGPVGAVDTPKMTGEFLGCVKHATARGVMLDRPVQVTPGDGVCWFESKGKVSGATVNGGSGAELILHEAGAVSAGVEVYRNRNHAFLNTLRKTRTVRRIDVAIQFSADANGATLTAIDEDGIRAELRYEGQLEAASKPEQALETTSKQLAKMGDSEFACNEVSVKMLPARFMPVAVLNALRRDLLVELSNAREASRPRETSAPILNDIPYPRHELTYLGNVLNKKAEAFYRRHGVDHIEPAAEAGIDLSGKIVMITRHCIKHQLNLCPKFGGKAHNGKLRLLDDDGKRLDLHFDCPRCQMHVLMPE
ncbi:MAG: U32 family peptidase [Candidatus Hydrogenedentales bacterium]